MEDLILDVIVIGGLPRDMVASTNSAPWPLDWTGGLAERAASDDDEDECDMDDADGLMAELASLLPVGDAFRRKSDLNFIIWCPELSFEILKKYKQYCYE